MSWEEMSTSQTVCPCGKGYITQKHPTPEKVEAIKDALKHFEVI